MRIYLAGPMSDIKDHNFPAFNEAAKSLRGQGWDVVNPAENDGGDTSKPWDYYVRKDLKQLVDCDAAVFLPGWQMSKGASLEHHVATALGIKVFFYRPGRFRNDSYSDLSSEDETTLEEAQRLVHGPRQKHYGHPADDFARTAGMWRALFGWDVRIQDVPMAMVCVKLSRETNAPKRDNRVDMAGYAETLELVHQRKEEE